ncbi:F-box/WD repeat-containing protein 2-like isoform X2 [Periplaneta americana]|uniref:F-box/WD repeat-containing protein 2-like isoform X2 n=1 Tax=Periplaneta americana TaxID=6978 RepID=UPI0037E86438
MVDDGGARLEGDGFSLLPVELHEYICSFLDGHTLGIASCVSKSWNRAISSFQGLWQKKCLELGTGPLGKETDWKELYAKYWPLVCSIKEGTAFQHKRVNTSHFLRGPSYTAVAYCYGYVLAAEGTVFGIWRIKDNKAVAIAFMDRKVSCLCVTPDAQMLAVGCHRGLIKTWTLTVGSHSFTKRSFKEYQGHTNNILCIHMSTEADLLASGAHDGTAKVWCLSSGQLLKSLLATSYVGQVTIYPCVGSVNSATSFEEKHSLLVMDDVDICIYSWSRNAKDDSQYGDIDSMEDDVVVFYKQDIGARRSRYHVHDGKFYYVQGTAISVYCLRKKVELNQIQLGFVNGDLLAVGDNYAMVTIWDSMAGELVFSVVNLGRRKLFGRFVVPGLVNVAVGEKEWLNSLAARKYHDVIFVATDINVRETPHINVYSWRNLEEAESSSKLTFVKMLKKSYSRFKLAFAGDG